MRSEMFFQYSPKIPLPLCWLLSGHVQGSVALLVLWSNGESQVIGIIYSSVLSLSSVWSGARRLGYRWSPIQTLLVVGIRCHHLPTHSGRFKRKIYTYWTTKQTNNSDDCTSTKQRQSLSQSGRSTIYPSATLKGTDGYGARTVTFYRHTLHGKSSLDGRATAPTSVTHARTRSPLK